MQSRRVDEHGFVLLGKSVEELSKLAVSFRPAWYFLSVVIRLLPWLPECIQELSNLAEASFLSGTYSFCHQDSAWLLVSIEELSTCGKLS